MKPFRMFGRSIRDAFKSVGRNFTLSLASITCISITLLIVSIAVLVSFNVQNFSKEIKEDVTMVVFLKLDVTDDEIKGFEKDLDEIGNIESKVLKTGDEQKQELINQDDFWETVLSTVGDEEKIFHNSYLIKVKDIEKINETADKIKALDMVEIVNYGESMVKQLIDAFGMLEKATFILVIVLVVVTVFLIVNTIKLTIFSRRREISIMRVVGASNITIKTPFVIEGMLIGVLGSLIPIAFTIYGYVALHDHFGGKLFSALFKLVDPEPFVYLTSLVILGLGILVGMLGSARAVRKYLKV